jgi:hypothetical protein
MLGGMLSSDKFGAHPENIRYFIPTVLFIKLAAASEAYQYIKIKKLILISVTLLCFTANFISLPKFHSAKPQGINDEIISVLRDNGLKDGYGSFFNSIIISAVTGFENEVFQVTSFTYPNKPGIYRFIFTSDRSWYVKPVNYLIVTENTPAIPNVNDQEILDFAYTQFGTPQKEISVHGRKILIWDYDISTNLNHVYLRFRSIKRTWENGLWEANGKNGSLIGFLNNYDKPLKVNFEMNIETDFDTEVYLSGAVQDSIYAQKGNKVYYANSFVLKPGRTNLNFSTPAKFKITDLKYDTEM